MMIYLFTMNEHEHIFYNDEDTNIYGIYDKNQYYSYGDGSEFSPVKRFIYEKPNESDIINLEISEKDSFYDSVKKFIEQKIFENI